MKEELGKYIQRLGAFGTIVIGAKLTSDGFAVLKTTAAAGKPAEVELIVIGAVAVLLGCLLMAWTCVEKRHKRKKGGRK
ncbi:hypothetical protein A2333_02970 [Candidatus Wolfebacteria bacterium RIFOXYB2_FULL_49_7]|uniref:Uncharacterized protein n=1 Tax=Candidatus Wolfebacteria bacterium RIFOXYB1_FULL_54_12 TaxID=1802559 RepID=A0A1F8DVI4_9BACT|nr:MAG: hypothetical protein A2372_04290 [Candidatus Wolfebacteria bacterium RIFOXYB1_FULL_54_12]OGM95772.1 MAG: hypothetical protein A2333_02970 [Candidatus Wolfebacteria bacterium RIFOXYB2_FULL_49_7]